MANEVFSALGSLGFETEGNFCFGSWKGCALLFQPAVGKSLYAIVSVDLPKAGGAERRALTGSLKAKGMKELRFAGLTKYAATFMLSYGKASDPVGLMKEALDAICAALRESGIGPAETCALTGAARPDSLCLISLGGALSYRPVCAAAIRDRDLQTREKVEENRENGSYVLGFGGALLGMLLGVIVNVLGIIFTERIYALLFALVPLAAMFGYKLCRGKMNKGSIVIVILLSLLGVFLIPMFELSYYFVKDYGASLMDALLTAAAAMTAPEFLSEIRSELLQLLLFMVLGVWIAWRFMYRQTNSSQVSGADAQLATLRPNPRFAQTAERDG